MNPPHEISKGCSDKIYPWPVELEPPFKKIALRDHSNNRLSDLANPVDSYSDGKKPVRFEIWPSIEGKFDWVKAELLIKHLSSSEERFSFEIFGNTSDISIRFLCYSENSPLLLAALQGQYEDYGIVSRSDTVLHSMRLQNWESVVFFDYFPNPPYSHLLTRSSELKISPLESLIQQIMVIPNSEFGLYQVVFQPVHKHNHWHRNVEILKDLEYKMSMHQDGITSNRLPQQSAAYDLHTASEDINNKAHDDKPFFSTALRLLITGNSTQSMVNLQRMHSVTNLFQHGGKSLNYLSENEYLDQITAFELRKMFVNALTYRPGFLLNSWELSSFVNFPTIKNSISQKCVINMQERLRLNTMNPKEGTCIGKCVSAGNDEIVMIPFKTRIRHTHMIGRNGVGKSSLLEHMAISDINNGDGIAVLDPHGDLIQNVLKRIPKSHIERVIYFDVGDPNQIPIWNPLYLANIQDRWRIADNLVSIFKRIVDGWGDRLERIMRNSFLGLLHRKGSTVLDVYKILHRHSKASEELRKEIMALNLTSSERLFWTEDFLKLNKDALDPPKNKLDKLLSCGSVSTMLSQVDNKFDFRKIMDEGLVLLVNLSNIGSENRDFLGSFILSAFHLAALSRANIDSKQRKPFHLYCDEAHRFVAGAVEDLVAETRKYAVSLTIAHQYLSQFPVEKRDALGNVGSTVIFNIDAKDAQSIRKNLRDIVSVEDIVSLKVGQAIARIDTEIVRFNTVYDDIPKVHWKDQIIERSINKYYKSCCDTDQKQLPSLKKNSKRGQENFEFEYDAL